MEAVLIDDRAPALLGIPEKKKEIRQVAPVGSVTVGPLKSMKELVFCKVVMPNFVDEVTLEDRGVRVILSPISPEVTQSMYASESRGKILPGSFLEVQQLQEDGGESVELAVNDVGWLISFYAGRRIHPLAWEGGTGRGTVWHIQNRQLITPLSQNYENSCVSNIVPLEHFLQHAWRAWQSYNKQRRAHLRGAVNFYADILSVTFSTQSLALTTMYLERFRDLMLGNSAVLQVINEDQEKVNAKSMAKRVRSTLRTIVEHNENLTADEQHKLTQAINKIGPGTMENVFRKTFRESLQELYERANLEVDPGELGRFIRERDKVIHGSWDSGRGEALETYRLAQYGLCLLEMLLLRLFEYKGPYFNRASFSTQIFPSGIASWQ